MARIIVHKNGEAIGVKDGSSLKDPCESLGVLFACEDGICGTCMIDIISGEDNLTEVSDKERDLDRDKDHRLACQCKIKKGEVRIDF
ncbi:MAG: 2Fe-2S iron-sulfur cluster-binding protein [Candidatus Nanoarchaeia archaeon]